jgi:hypothetical protein
MTDGVASAAADSSSSSSIVASHSECRCAVNSSPSTAKGCQLQLFCSTLSPHSSLLHILLHRLALRTQHVITRVITFVTCSLKDALYKRRMERELLRANGLLAAAEKPPEEDGPAGPRPAGLPSAPKPGSYVPPSVRNR